MPRWVDLMLMLILMRQQRERGDWGGVPTGEGKGAGEVLGEWNVLKRGASRDLSYSKVGMPEVRRHWH